MSNVSVLRLLIVVVASVAALGLIVMAASVATLGVLALATQAQSAPIERQAATGERTQRLSRAERVCCRRNWQNWWTTRQYCNDAAGGRQVANRKCRNNWNDNWDSRWWSWEGGSWSSRVCCRHGATDRWTRARDCRDSAGFPTATRFCRRAF